MDDGSKSHPFGHALVAGIERYPSKVTRNMSKKKMSLRSKVKPFVKVINYNHLMPTRYTLDLESLKGVISQDTFKEPTQREEAKKTIKKAFEERYQTGKNKWFFTRKFPHWIEGGKMFTLLGLDWIWMLTGYGGNSSAVLDHFFLYFSSLWGFLVGKTK